MDERYVEAIRGPLPDLGRDPWIRLLSAVLCGSLALLAGGCGKEGGEPARARVSGTATYRERMALPPGAVFEAILEDVSRADAPAEVLGQARLESPGNPPFRFTIDYGPARIDPLRRYSVRARITVEGLIIFATDAGYPVLTRGHPDTVDMLLRRAAAPPAVGAQGPTGARRMSGMYRYMADAGMFVDCATGQRLPVAMEGDNGALEAGYGRARAGPGDAVLAVVEGWIEGRMPMEGPGPRPTLIVDRFISIGPGGCPSTGPGARLEDTYWKLLRLGTDPVGVAESGREPHLVLQADDERVAGSGGCNRLTGSYTLEGDRLSFGQMAATMMACSAGMELEQAFHDALQKVAGWRIDGETLELFDAAGASVAQFESRPTP